MEAATTIARLRREAAGEVRSDDASRELYSADASLYRRLPVATLRAAVPEDLDAAVAACGEGGVPLTMRGAGTSLAGQAVGAGLVVDCTALASIEIDPGARVARVGPGVVLDDLNAAARAHGLAFGPDVASGSRATLGGMVANNSAGARSIAYGLTSGHVLALEVTLADGTRATLRRGAPAPPRSRPRAPWRRRPGRRACCGASRATTSGRSRAPTRTGRVCCAGRRARSRSSGRPRSRSSSPRRRAGWRSCRSRRSTPPSRRPSAPFGGARRRSS